MAKENKRIKKLIGDNGIIEKADYFFNRQSLKI